MAEAERRQSAVPTATGQQAIYETRQHEVAADKIRYAVEEGEGVFLLTGENGTGKTLLAQWLVRHWERDETVVTGLVANPPKDATASLLRLILCAFGLSSTRLYEDNLEILFQFLADQDRMGRKCVLIVDNVHRVPPRKRDIFQTLLCEQPPAVRPMKIVLLAHPSVRLGLSERPALKNLITGTATLDSLTLTEAVGMMRHRMTQVGYDFDALIPSALHRPLYNAARGNPADLCLLCDRTVDSVFRLQKSVADDRCLSAALAQMAMKNRASQGRPAFLQ